MYTDCNTKQFPLCIEAEKACLYNNSKKHLYSRRTNRINKELSGPKGFNKDISGLKGFKDTTYSRNLNDGYTT